MYHKPPQAINHELRQFSVTLSGSFSTFIIHEERLDYGFLRAKGALFITVWSVPSMPSGCSPCISPSSPFSSSVLSTNTECLCVQLPSKDGEKKINKTCWPFALHWLTNRLNCWLSGSRGSGSEPQINSEQKAPVTWTQKLIWDITKGHWPGMRLGFLKHAVCTVSVPVIIDFFTDPPLPWLLSEQYCSGWSCCLWP